MAFIGSVSTGSIDAKFGTPETQTITLRLTASTTSKEAAEQLQKYSSALAKVLEEWNADDAPLGTDLLAKIEELIKSADDCEPVQTMTKAAVLVREAQETNEKDFHFGDEEIPHLVIQR